MSPSRGPDPGPTPSDPGLYGPASEAWRLNREAMPEALLPPDIEAFEAYIAAMLAPDGPVQVSAVARELARAVLRPPLEPLAPLLPFGSVLRPALGRVPPAMYAWTLWPAVGLLPASVRAAYGLRWGTRERVVAG